jgi:hypothetical protein
MTKINIFHVILFAFLPLGQIWARVFLLNGSLDRKWLFLPFFFMPPFSLIPMIMMKLGKVKKGKGSKPYDLLMLIPIILHLLMKYVVVEYFEDEKMFNILYILLIYGATIGILLYRISKDCKFKASNIGKNIMDSVRILAISELIPFLLSYIPIISKFYNGITMIPTIGTIITELIWSFAYVSSYTLNNMINQDNMNRYCNVPLVGNIEDIIIFVLSMISTVFIKIFNNISDNIYGNMFG